ncbi:EAL domain-containing protein [Deinococcus hohokamensis]|uniref:EAL domain-containing protein n=1 Tax=Deinococcus hohokamensis TaxID=309883 RepID=A0ABV9I876_9DEIO
MTSALPAGCQACQAPAEPLEISMAFQPIVNVPTREVFAYEALVRGPQGQPAGWVFEQLPAQPEGLYHFDQACRVTAIRWAARLGMQTRLSINFLPNAVYEPSTCLRATLRAAREVQFPLDRLLFEITEHEHVLDESHVRGIIEAYRQYGFQTALDDYGSGHASAGLLLALRPDLVKIDMNVVRGLHEDPWREALVAQYARFAAGVGVLLIAEGVETKEEADCLLKLGVTHMQGYYFAKPGFEELPEVPAARYDALALPRP